MRLRVVPLCALSLVGVALCPSISQSQSFDGAPKLHAMLKRAREALGGRKLAQVKTLTATGRGQRDSIDGLLPFEFSFALARPDRYMLREDSLVDGQRWAIGFADDRLIREPARLLPLRVLGGPPQITQSRSATSAALLSAARHDAMRLWLGLTADVFALDRSSLVFAGLAIAPEDSADAIDVRGPSDFLVRLFISRSTHRPLMVSWSTTAGEERLYFADHRDVDGVRLPFRIRRARGSATYEELVVDRYRLNRRVSARMFGTP